MVMFCSFGYYFLAISLDKHNFTMFYLIHPRNDMRYLQIICGNGLPTAKQFKEILLKTKFFYCDKSVYTM